MNVMASKVKSLIHFGGLVLAAMLALVFWFSAQETMNLKLVVGWQKNVVSDENAKKTKRAIKSNKILESLKAFDDGYAVTMLSEGIDSMLVAPELGLLHLAQIDPIEWNEGERVVTIYLQDKERNSPWGGKSPPPAGSGYARVYWSELKTAACAALVAVHEAGHALGFDAGRNHSEGECVMQKLSKCDQQPGEKCSGEKWQFTVYENKKISEFLNDPQKVLRGQFGEDPKNSMEKCESCKLTDIRGERGNLRFKVSGLPDNTNVQEYPYIFLVKPPRGEWSYYIPPGYKEEVSRENKRSVILLPSDGKGEYLFSASGMYDVAALIKTGDVWLRTNIISINITQDAQFRDLMESAGNRAPMLSQNIAIVDILDLHEQEGTLSGFVVESLKGRLSSNTESLYKVPAFQDTMNLVDWNLLDSSLLRQTVSLMKDSQASLK